jgi:ABC-type sugar transport system substrate-binding protein
VLAACGGSNDDSGGADNSAGDAADVAPAQEIVDAHTEAPTAIGPTEPVGVPIPPNKHVVVIGCGPGAEGCQHTFTALGEAADVLGWQVDEVNPPSPAPADLQAAFDQAIRMSPDAVVYGAVSITSFERQAAQLRTMGIPLIGVYGSEPTGGDITLQVMGSEDEVELTRTLAAQTVVDLGGTGTIGVVGLDGYPIVKATNDAYIAEIQRLCASCEIEETSLSPASLGTTAGTDIVNFLRANPAIKGVLLGYDGLGAALVPAAASAGVDLPYVYSISTVTTGVQQVKDGDTRATVPVDYGETGWRIADALARIFTDQTDAALTQDSVNPTPVIWSSEHDNVPSVSGDTFPPVVEGYAEQYQELWGK